MSEKYPRMRAYCEIDFRVQFRPLTSVMAASPAPAALERKGDTSFSSSVPFNVDRPPIIEGFSPLPRAKDETFKEKFIRKTKENPFVPIGQLHKLRNASELLPGVERFTQHLQEAFQWKRVRKGREVIISTQSFEFGDRFV